MPSTASATVTKAPKQRKTAPTAAAADNQTKAAAPDTTDFFWTYTEEPHRTRRNAIIKAHPEVEQLSRPPPPPLRPRY